MYLPWNLPFFNMVPTKTNFFPFLKPWADNSSTNKYSQQLFSGWGMTYLVPSILKVHIVAEGPGETPSASRCVSYLIDSFLTDIKQLAETSKGGILHRPMMPVSEAFSVLFLILQKSATQKLLSDQARSLVPKLKLLQRSRIQHHSP